MRRKIGGLDWRRSVPFLLVSPLLAVAASWAQTEYVPGRDGDWERRQPAEVGLDPARLEEAVAFARGHETPGSRDLRQVLEARTGEPFGEIIGPVKERGEQTGVILRYGYLVTEWGEPQRVDMTFSVTKSFLSTTVGLAWDDGLIPDLHAPVRETAPLEELEGEHNGRITWDHLLRQTSDWQGTLWGKPDWADRPEGDPQQWLTRERHAPGDVYKYNDVRVNLLALAALNVWRRPLPQVLKERIMDPIGSSASWRWHGYDNSWVTLDGLQMQSVSGGGHWGGGMFLSARDQARFGLLTLRRGRWGERQLLSEAWLDLATTPTPANRGYGFMNFFLNTDREMLPSAPESTFCHLGSGTNMICILREHELVIVARWIERSAMDGLVARVLGALVEPGGGGAAGAMPGRDDG